MHISKLGGLLGVLLVVVAVSCKNKEQKNAQAAVLKGLYSLGPEMKLFKDCATGHEYWVTDSTKQLELQYWQMVPTEKPDQPVYIEVEGQFMPSDDNDDGGHDDEGGYDSTLVVKKLITITKQIPAGSCN